MLVVIVGILLPLGIALNAIRSAGWDPTILVAFGEEATPTREYAEARLGDVYLRATQGHDGKFFFVQANDPWVLNPDQNALILDRPLYRSQRMLYPVLAGGFGLFGPETIVWAMLTVNLLAMGLGTWVAAHVAMDLGGSPWWGISFPLNLGFLSEMLIGGAGVVSAAAAFAAVLLMMRGRRGWGIALLVVAALAREAMLIAAAGTGLWLWLRRERRQAALSLFIPAMGVGLWAVYLRLAIGEGTVTSQVQEIGPPFFGFIAAFSHWMAEPINLAAGIAIMILFALFTRRVVISRHLVGVAFVGFVLLGIVFTEQVWHSYFDITRAVAPIITSFVLLVFLSEEATSRHQPVMVESAL
ncbi:MAG TPA: hypothetical protein VJ935_07205 [Acidimicrobiia bacterium]|nr:hypothetical protein [Acidimicrobiia bacterium]